MTTPEGQTIMENKFNLTHKQSPYYETGNSQAIIQLT